MMGKVDMQLGRRDRKLCRQRESARKTHGRLFCAWFPSPSICPATCSYYVL